MTDKQTFITKEGLERLNTELQELKTNKRRELADRIRDAKELGDLSENAEYIQAKEEQAFVEGKIQELEYLLKHVTVIASHHESDEICVGSKVRARVNGQELEFMIVGSNESNPSVGLISNESPLGRAFLGHRRDEKISVPTPRGDILYEIVKIQ
jgi:transcription elongation factor GreA